MVFMMPHDPLSTEAPPTAREMTSEAVYSELEGAVQGCSTWYLPPAGGGSGAARSTLQELNRAAVENILKVAEVRSCMLSSTQIVNHNELCCCRLLNNCENL